jgi:putative iron-regulated protein
MFEKKSAVLRLLAASLIALMAFTIGCGSGEDPTATPTATLVPSGPSDELTAQVIADYASGVYASYAASLASARTMDTEIDVFLANPTEATLAAARQAWLTARADYSPTEAFRFYGGPIDDEETGVEGLVNAWPLDEGYIDYVEGNASSGIINMPGEYPVIDASVLVSLNEEGGEANISTGWHAIEFLLWGQDMDADGPGGRPATDYTTAANADRRGTYLSVSSGLLVSHLEGIAAAWAPDTAGNYRAAFVAFDHTDALNKIITGIGELSRGELAGERMTVAYEERSQEDEHSCFSDNTTNDIIGNASGIQSVYLGEYNGFSGMGLIDLVRASDAALADRLADEIAESVRLARAIPAPFDQSLGEEVPNSDPGRQSILATIESLEGQTDTIVNAADALGVTISVS